MNSRQIMRNFKRAAGQKSPAGEEAELTWALAAGAKSKGSSFWLKGEVAGVMAESCRGDRDEVAKSLAWRQDTL